MLYNNNIDESLLQVTSNPPLLRKQKAFNNIFELRTMNEVINEMESPSETSNASNASTLQYSNDSDNENNYDSDSDIYSDLKIYKQPSQIKKNNSYNLNRHDTPKLFPVIKKFKTF